jgi:hypothetical protein
MSASNVKVSCAIMLYLTSQRLSFSRPLNTAFMLPRFGRRTYCFLLPRTNIVRALTAPGCSQLSNTRSSSATIAEPGFFYWMGENIAGAWQDLVV